MKNILLTGGAEFIGSHGLDALIKLGNSVTVIDNFDPFYDRSEKEANLGSSLANECLRIIE